MSDTDQNPFPYGNAEQKATVNAWMDRNGEMNR
jgi:hypothetical protein